MPNHHVSGDYELEIGGTDSQRILGFVPNLGQAYAKVQSIDEELRRLGDIEGAEGPGPRVVFRIK